MKSSAQHTTVSVPGPSASGAAAAGTRRVFGEKFMLLLAFLAFCIMCFGALFFVPDLRPVGFTPAPGDAAEVDGPRGMAAQRDVPDENLNPRRNNPVAEREAKRFALENARLRKKQLEQQLDQLDRLENQGREDDSQLDLNQDKFGNTGDQADTRTDQEKEAAVDVGLARADPPVPENPKQQPQNNDNNNNNDAKLAVVADSEWLDPETQRRQDYVREMMQHAWNGYAKHSWGHNEHRPNARGPHNSGLFGQQPLGATIVDSLDTLLIMGLVEDFQKARDWVATSLDFKVVNSYTSVFETNIRWVGGLLSAYALSKDEIFKTKAVEIADLLLPAFNTPTGLPFAMCNLNSGHARNHDWAGGSSILAEVGTLDLEFQYLSDITGNEVYRNKVLRIRKHMKDISKPDGLYPNYISPHSGSFGQNHVSLGGLGDSFYEYLLKSYLISGKQDKEVRAMYDTAMKNVIRVMIPPRVNPTDAIYVAEARGGGSLDHKMDHLACFAGGMFALGAEGDTHDEHFEIGAGITQTCRDSYDMTASKIGPESFRIDPNTRRVQAGWSNNGYILRPEVVESYFVMWRLTHDPKYREWAWEAAQAINQHCRADTGFSGINDVNSAHPPKDDVQQSFFLAETLKYLYLTFSHDSLIPLEDYVFNTEAHPLPVKTRRATLAPLI
ncbi:mannosidase [Capsaspora owczarzaki ATCC 30864]|nr:mannosidase [Capsaspora owczarzaki ATCC 30864]|eukprot:XP_004365487.2 mannosidase [Capsaspora owczarzaki ATCC 30864]